MATNSKEVLEERNKLRRDVQQLKFLLTSKNIEIGSLRAQLGQRDVRIADLEKSLEQIELALQHLLTSNIYYHRAIRRMHSTSVTEQFRDVTTDKRQYRKSNTTSTTGQSNIDVTRKRQRQSPNKIKTSKKQKIVAKVKESTSSKTSMTSKLKKPNLTSTHKLITSDVKGSLGVQKYHQCILCGFNTLAKHANMSRHFKSRHQVYLEKHPLNKQTSWRFYFVTSRPATRLPSDVEYPWVLTGDDDFWTRKKLRDANANLCWLRMLKSDVGKRQLTSSSSTSQNKLPKQKPSKTVEPSDDSDEDNYRRPSDVSTLDEPDNLLLEVKLEQLSDVDVKIEDSD